MEGKANGLVITLRPRNPQLAVSFSLESTLGLSEDSKGKWESILKVSNQEWVQEVQSMKSQIPKGPSELWGLGPLSSQNKQKDPYKA